MNNKFTWAVPDREISPEDCCRKEYAEIVIVGAGQSGVCAARAASQGGASVICIEAQSRDKQWFPGIGVIGHINSKWQASKGIPRVDVDEFVNEWQIRTGNRSDYRLIKKFAMNSGRCFDWLIEPLSDEEKESIKAIYHPVSPNFPTTVNTMHSHYGAPYLGMPLQSKVLKANIALAEENGARFLHETKGLQPIMENNRVAGIIAEDAEGYIAIYASRAVIIAAGDYSRNKEMCRDLLVEAADLIDEDADWSGFGWDGSGIRLGMYAGGRLEPRPHAPMGGNYSFPGFGSIGSAAMLRVNKYGKRYSDEGFYNHIWAAVTGARQPNGMLWGIFDSNIDEQLTHQPCNHGSVDYTNETEMETLHKAMKNAINTDGKTQTVGRDGVAHIVYSGNTIEELASKMFSDEESIDNFVKSVHRYNELCYEGKDVDFGKDPALLLPIEKPPFFACGQEKDMRRPGAQSLKLLVTVSGLMINYNQQVLNEEFEPIEGLYATGNSSGCRFGAAYATSIPGESISIANTLGMLLGEKLASE